VGQRTERRPKHDSIVRPCSMLGCRPHQR
jgi:hypothetical protein